MAGEGGRLEEVGGDSEKKVRIVGGFTWAILLAIAVVLLLAGVVLFFGKGKGLPDATSQPDKQGSVRIECPVESRASSVC